MNTPQVVTSDSVLLKLAQQVGSVLSAHGLKLASAESCTGGWIGQVMTAVPGSSAWYDRGFITYSNLSKRQMLCVQAQTLLQFGAVSEQTAREMAQGAHSMSQAQIAVSVTGIAGPTGGSVEKPVGTVCFAWVLESGAMLASNSKTCYFHGDREAIRRQTVVTALQGVLELLENFMPTGYA